ncbi:MAG TPA: type I methionyl aminopeptidase [Terriglobia bacterium]|jgi:methionyl aminopeptidase|nr:type I methionyl aminopeptidase [Terriglobia bacterium]
MIICKSPAEIEKLRRSGRVVREVLEELRSRVRPGTTTLDLERFVDRRLEQLKVRPAFKGYRGYPCCLCASVNEEVIHGIPSDRRLNEGDIVSLDLGVIVDGYYGDSAITQPVGEISEETRKLLRVTEESLELAIEKVRLGRRLGDISATVQQHVEKNGFSVVREFVGHGIGRELHEEPQIPNFGHEGHGPVLKEGMVFAIEPMVNSGGPEVRVLEDHWTAVTVDGRNSAHFEHMVAVTRNGPDVLTRL